MFWKILKITGIVIFVFITVGAVWLAITNGQKSAQSRQIVKDAAALAVSLEYFYEDQNRYPSNDEFLDQNVMRQYADNFPPQQFLSATCSENYQYVNTFRTDYELRFCLPKGVAGYRAGWNTLKAPTK